MLHIVAQPVQSLALGVLKYDSNQAREPKGSPEGGQFASDPTHARTGDITQLQHAMLGHVQRSKYPGSETWGPQAWLSKPHVRAAMKEGIQSTLTVRLNDHPAFANFTEGDVSEWVKDKIDLWADTSGDHNANAIRMQEAVRLEFGLEAEMGHLGGEPEVKNADEMAKMRAFVRAEYERTQEWFKEQGITYVSVFRGMSEGGALGYDTVTMQPASSWTTNLAVAMEFANQGLTDTAVAMTTRVPVSDVLSTAVTGRGCLPEEEILLLGKPQRVRGFDVSGRDIDLKTYDPETYDRLDARGRQRILASLE